MNKNHARVCTAIAYLLLAAILAACGGAASPANAVSVRAMDTFAFDPPTISTQAGAETAITLVNAGALEHAFVIDELDFRIGPLLPGEQITQALTPDAAGSYDFYCDVLGHREAGMVGTLTVTP